MAIPEYNIGDQIVVTTTYTVGTNPPVPTSPSTRVGEYRKPSGAAAVALTPALITTGVFTITLPPFDEAGTWGWYQAGTAGVIAADQGFVKVLAKTTA